MKDLSTVDHYIFVAGEVDEGRSSFEFVKGQFDVIKAL